MSSVGRANSYVGHPIKRREDRRLLLGRGHYVADIKREGMLSMAVLRATSAHARIVSIDTSEVRALPGVEAVLTFADIKDLVGQLPCTDLGPDTLPALHDVLAREVVRYVGEPIAVVVASDAYAAEDALESFVVDYEDLPVVLDPVAACEKDAPLLYPQFETNRVNTWSQDVGHVEAALASAHKVYEETFRIHRYGAIPMETRGVIAEVDPISGRLTLWTSTQAPHQARTLLSQVLSLPESHIKVVAPDVGGGFGGKLGFYPEEVLAPILAMRLGRPVKWVEDRREHMLSSTQAREQVHHVRLAVDENSVVTGIDVESWTNNGAALQSTGLTPSSIFSAMLRGPYRIPNYRARSHAVVTNKTPLGVYRGAGHPQAAFVMERMMDIVALDRGLDRADFRRLNMLTPDELPSDRGTDIVAAGHVEYDTGDYPTCMQMALDLIDYTGFADEQVRARDEGRYLGLGFACYVEETSIGPYEAADVKVDPQGKVTVRTGATSSGQGHITAFSQLVAEEFDIPIADVTVLSADTDVVTDGVGSFASRSGAIGGAAARMGARRVREKAMRVAAHVLEISVDDLEWVNGGAQARGVPSQRRSLGELATLASAWNEPVPNEANFNLEDHHRHQVPGISFANATHAAVVEVDRNTGELKVLRYAVVHDCGTVINPLIVEGQVHGGVAQGLGGSLLEEFAYDDRGQPLCTTFMDYLLPTAFDIPHMDTDHLESPTHLNPFGMKGAGEGGAVGSPAALVNAIADALRPWDIHVADDGPFAPSRIHSLMGDVVPNGAAR
jgi:carbon-monoxide dehydrogenase large subunit